mgnify:CR=1 FL=1
MSKEQIQRFFSKPFRKRYLEAKKNFKAAFYGFFNKGKIHFLEIKNGNRERDHK